MTNEEIISSFLQTAYSDEKLAMLLAHAQDGKLVYDSCCCFIGIPTADHPLQSLGGEGADHYSLARELPNAYEAERAFILLGTSADPDAERRERLIPLILAELDRRSRSQPRNELSLVTQNVAREVCAA